MNCASLTACSLLPPRSLRGSQTIILSSGQPSRERCSGRGAGRERRGSSEAKRMAAATKRLSDEATKGQKYPCFPPSLRCFVVSSLAPPDKAHSSTFRALLLVQTAPPCSPTKALMSADEFMYVTGTMDRPGSTSFSWFQQSTVWSRSAMSAIEQPAPRSGRMTRTSGRVRMSALSAMKCTPQKTTNSASLCRAAKRDNSKLSPTKSANSTTLSCW